MVDPPCNAVPIADVTSSTTMEVELEVGLAKGDEAEEPVAGGVPGADGELAPPTGWGADGGGVLDTGSEEVVAGHGA